MLNFKLKSSILVVAIASASLHAQDYEVEDVSLEQMPSKVAEKQTAKSSNSNLAPQAIKPAIDTAETALETTETSSTETPEVAPEIVLETSETIDDSSPEQESETPIESVETTADTLAQEPETTVEIAEANDDTLEQEPETAVEIAEASDDTLEQEPETAVEIAEASDDTLEQESETAVEITEASDDTLEQESETAVEIAEATDDTLEQESETAVEIAEATDDTLVQESETPVEITETAVEDRSEFASKPSKSLGVRGATCQENFYALPIYPNAKYCQLFAEQLPASMSYFSISAPQDAKDFYINQLGQADHENVLKGRIVLQYSSGQKIIVISKDGQGSQVDVLIKSAG
ncbi:hypothetical protein [uncultured Paraglaciecola sp.]|uniref:hypothetical protein n=1 Tax=uncultured Paraglaciecola sp. TaxID=1765024 RepID=UPI002631F4B7|nr:hypothetical protein [uncultured Paraglaciecola sp.]